jgi:hypothetical protein
MLKQGNQISHILTVSLDHQTYQRLEEIVEKRLLASSVELENSTMRAEERERLIAEVFRCFVDEDRAEFFAELMSEGAIDSLLMAYTAMQKREKRYDMTRTIQACVKDYIDTAYLEKLQNQ